MYNKNDNIGCLAALFLIILFFGIAVAVGFFITKITIWFVMGIFEYDLSDKFWYIFVAWVILLPALRNIFTITVNKK